MSDAPAEGEGGAPGALFAYGTLQLEAVVRTVLGRWPPAREAELPGYARWRVAGVLYPGLLEEPGAAAGGLLYAPVTGEDWTRLDAFEGPLYERRAVRVRVGEGTEWLPAQAYVVPAERAHRLTAEPWDLEAFRVRHLGRFLGDGGGAG